MKAAKANVGNKYSGALEIYAAHRKRNGKEPIIVKFTNKKFANAALYNSRNLKDVKLYEDEEQGGNKKIYINESLCPEFGYLHYAVRQAKIKGEIHYYKSRKGVMFIKKTEVLQGKQYVTSYGYLPCFSAN